MKVGEKIETCKDIYLTRSVPKTWKGKDGFSDLLKYVASMDEDLKNIKRYYAKDFHNLDGNRIEDYINIFNECKNNLYNSLYTKEQMSAIKAIAKVEKIPFSFATVRAYLGYRDNEIFKNFKSITQNIYGRTTGFLDEEYKTIKDNLKKIFMIEKYVSVATRKIWQNEIQTDPNLINLDDNFNILVKVIFPNGWRNSKYNEKTAEYLKSKKYQSSSLIDKAHKHNLFLYQFHDICACLMISTKGENIICAGDADVFSTELINGSDRLDKLMENKGFMQTYTDILKVDEKNKNNKKHECFAVATEIATPKGIFSEHYNEVVVFDPKYVAVISPNRNSDEFAENIAKNRNLPIKYM